MTDGLASAGRSFRLLLVVGSDREARLTDSGRRMISGATNIQRLLGNSQPFDRLRVRPGFRADTPRQSLLRYTCIANMITDADENPRVLGELDKFLRAYPGRVINRPEHVLRSTRDQAARQLAGIDGLRAPRTLRLRAMKAEVAADQVAKSGIGFPVILRRAGTHTGNIVGLFDDLADLRGALGGEGEHILTEFADFQSADGLYRKYRVFFIGNHIIFRHMLVSDAWNVHAHDRSRFMAGRPDLIAEEERLFSKPDGDFPANVHEVLRAVRKRIPLDFFGMDFSIDAGGLLVLFEANATMNFFPFVANPLFDYAKACLMPAHLAFRDMVGLPPPAPGFAAAPARAEPA